MVWVKCSHSGSVWRTRTNQLILTHPVSPHRPNSEKPAPEGGTVTAEGLRKLEAEDTGSWVLDRFFLLLFNWPLVTFEDVK